MMSLEVSVHGVRESIPPLTRLEWSSLVAWASAASVADCPLPCTLAARVERRPGDGAAADGPGGAPLPPMAEAAANNPPLSDSLDGLDSGGAALLRGSALAAMACTDEPRGQDHGQI